jgi:hypothetical protein
MTWQVSRSKVQGPKSNKRDYYPKITWPKCFAPAATQSLISVLSDAKRIGGGTDLLLKTRVSLVPNRPTYEHGDGGHSFSAWGSHRSPSWLDGEVRCPLLRSDGGKPEPIFGQTPKPLGEPAMGEKVRCHLSSLFAKRAKTTIVPTSFLKAIGRLKPNADSQPRKKLDLRWCPSLPNQPIHASSHGPEELCLICRLTREI